MTDKKLIANYSGSLKELQVGDYLDLFGLKLRNSANTFINAFANSTTAARTWTLPDATGTIALLSDILSTTLSGLSIAAGTVSSSDTILQAIGKLASLVDNNAWLSWTPTWTNLTIGNGTVTAKYKQIGKTVFARVSVTGGTTSSSNGAAQQISLPVTAVSLPVYTPLGQGIWNTGALVFPFAPHYTTATSACLMWIATGASGSTVTYSLIGPGLAAGHTISLFFCYEAA